MAKPPTASPPSSAPPIRQIRPPVELDHPPRVEPTGELPSEDGDYLGAGPGPGGQRQEKILRPASSSDLSSASSVPFLYLSARPPAGPRTGPETGLGSGPGALLLTLKGLLKNISPSVSSSNHNRDLPVTALSKESWNQTHVPHTSNPLIHQDQTWWKHSSQVHPTLPGPSPLFLHTDVSPSCPLGPLWPFCASGHLTPPPTIQTGRRQKVAFFSPSNSTSSSATTTSGASSQRPLTFLLTEKEILSVVKIPSLSLYPPSPVSHAPSHPSPPPSLPALPSASSSSSLPLSSASAPPLPSPPTSHPASISPSRHLPSSPFFPPPLTPPSPTPRLSLFLPLSPPSLPPPPSRPPSPLPTPAVPAVERNLEPMSLVTDQTEPKVGPYAGPHPGSFDSVVSPPIPPSYLQAPPTAVIHSASDGQTVKEAWLQSEDVGISTTSLSVPLTTTFALSPAHKSGPSKGSLSAPLSLGGHTHLADNSPPPHPQPRPLHCLFSTWLCGRSSANRTSLLQTAAIQQRANQSDRHRQWLAAMACYQP